MRRVAAGVVLLAMAGAAGPASGQPAGRLEPTDDPVVVDATGAVVGPLLAGLAPIGLGLVQVQVGGRAALLAVGSDRMLAFLQARFESADCTGAPLVPDLGVVSLLTPLVELGSISPLNEVLVGDGAAVTRYIRSEWDGQASPPACQPVGPENQVVRPGAVLADLDALVPPFRLR